MNNKNIRDLIIDEADLDIHPFAREQELAQEPEVMVLSHEDLLERRKQEIAQSRWW